MLDQEAIHDALFRRLKAEVQVKYATRDWIDPSTLASVNRQPALEYSVEGDTDAAGPLMPPVLTMRASLDIYCLHSGQSRDATANLLDLVAQVRKALVRKGNERSGDEGFYTTLGGLVQWAKVTRVEIIEGHVTGQGEAIVTIEMQAIETD